MPLTRRDLIRTTALFAAAPALTAAGVGTSGPAAAQAATDERVWRHGLSLFGTLGAREFEDPAYFAAHRLTVDAYCLPMFRVAPTRKS